MTAARSSVPPFLRYAVMPVARKVWLPIFVSMSAAAGFALDREGGDAEIREGMGVVAHGGEPVFGRVHHQLPSAPPPPEEPPPGSKLIGRTGGKGGSSGIGWW
jgi:hypothetical protein